MSKIVIVGEGYPPILNAIDFCMITYKTIKERYPNDEISFYPLASGGRGSVQTMIHYQKGDLIKVLNKTTIESYYLNNDIALIEGNDDNSEYRWQLLISDSINKGATSIYLALKGEDISFNNFTPINKEITLTALGDSKLHLKLPIINGAKFFFNLSKVEQKISEADLIITSTFQISNDYLLEDSISMLIKKAKEYNKQLLILSGTLPEYKLPGVDLYSLSPENMPLDIALKELSNNLRYTLIDLMREDII